MKIEPRPARAPKSGQGLQKKYQADRDYYLDIRNFIGFWIHGGSLAP